MILFTLPHRCYGLSDVRDEQQRREEECDFASHAFFVDASFFFVRFDYDVVSAASDARARRRRRPTRTSAYQRPHRASNVYSRPSLAQYGPLRLAYYA